MIANLTPYPAYKVSGVEWLGEVPAHWEVRRLRNAVTMRGEQCRQAYAGRRDSSPSL